MSTKLTLSLDPDVIAAAKRFAAEHGTSVSHLVEAFLGTVTRGPDAQAATPVLVRCGASTQRTTASISRASTHEAALVGRSQRRAGRPARSAATRCDGGCAVVSAAAEASGCSVIVTRDPRGFAGSALPVHDPATAVALLVHGR
jgi:hypothetical protein